jgi:hypothetical protein
MKPTLKIKPFSRFIALTIICIYGFTMNYSFAAGTANIQNSSTLSASANVCQGSAAPTTTAAFTVGCGGGGALSSTVTVTWYYNTTGATGTLAGSTVLLTQTLQSTGTGATISYSLTSGTAAYNTLMNTVGTYYIFCTITSPSSTACAPDFTETVGATLYSGTSGSPGNRPITVSAPPTTATISQSSPINLTCPTTTAALTGNTPVTGTGTWSVTSGSGSVSPTNTPGTTATVTPGSSAVFTWTISNPGCPSSSASITVSVPLCNDDPCGASSITVSNATSCTPTATMTNVGATMSTGMPEPPCGNVFGPDVWYSAVVPSNGTLSINGIGSGTFDPMVSIYDGSCSSLQAAGCAAPILGATQSFPLSYTGVPGSTVYIRVNEALSGDSPTGSFGVCAYSNTATISQVLPGDTTTIACGSTLNFYDPGGLGGGAVSNTNPTPAGNYEDNSSALYTICPDNSTSYVTANFSSFLLETGFDKLIVLAGDTVIAQWTGSDGSGDIVSSQYPGQCLSFVLQTDYSFSASGWAAVVSCQPSPVAPQISNACQVNNCNGGCGVWVCGDGTYNTTAGGGSGVDEINEVTGGCWGAAGEVATSWFYFTTATSGSLEFEFVPSNSGHNINFALYGPSTDGVPPCPLLTGDAPVRCSFADVGGANTGLQTGSTDSYDGLDGNSFASPLNVQAGETYALVVDVYQNGVPPTSTTINFNGTLGLDCTPVTLPVTLSDFSGINQNRQNLLTWIVNSQINNDYFTIERSYNGQSWNVVGIIDGAGTTQSMMYYSLIDENPFFPISYYRLKQTDFDGESSYSKIISVSNNKLSPSDFIGEIFPNPANDFTTFTYEGNDSKTPINVNIKNDLGQSVLDLTFTNVNKSMGTMIPTSSIASGTYHVIFTQGQEKQVKKLTIIR